MWFKSLQLFRLPAPWTISIEALREQLARGPAGDPASNEPTRRGWASPRNDGDLVFALNRQWLIRLGVATRLLPSGVVNSEAQARAKALETQQGYAPGRKQLKELRERVTEELMPRSFIQRRNTFAWIDPQAGWFAVDAGSPARAEEVIEHLRHCLDDFPLKALHTQLSPTSAMADWLAGGEAPYSFTVDPRLPAQGGRRGKGRCHLHPAPARRRRHRGRGQGPPGGRQVADQAGADLGRPDQLRADREAGNQAPDLPRPAEGTG